MTQDECHGSQCQLRPFGRTMLVLTAVSSMKPQSCWVEETLLTNPASTPHASPVVVGFRQSLRYFSCVAAFNDRL
jgi:hypothetical protein